MSKVSPTRVTSLDSPRIERMTEHDLLEVVEIEEMSGLSRWGWSAYHSELKNSDRGLMLILRVKTVAGKQVAAFLVSRLVADELHVNNIAVRDGFLRRGFGSALLKRVLEVGKEVGARIAVLEVRDSNKTAQALYASCGFRVVGRRSEYYADPQEDALIMRAEL
jgi:[ribosomal protein S18]-alanine N-acetyltransferase